MAYDISTEIATIRNSVRGEDVRDAIVSLFQKVNESSVGVTITTAEYKALTEAEKNNGTLYFVSDMSIEDGDEMYYGDNEGVSTHVVISKETALGIVNAVRELAGIDANIRLSHVPALIGTSGFLVRRYARLLTGSYNSGSTWYYYPNATKKYVIDIYRVSPTGRFMAGLGMNLGTRCYISVFKENPVTATANITGGTSVSSTTSVSTMLNYRFTLNYEDIEEAYIAICVSNASKLATDTFVIDCTLLGETLEGMQENDDIYDAEDDED